MVSIKAKVDKGKLILNEPLPKNIQDGDVTIVIHDNLDKEIKQFEQTYLNDINLFNEMENL